jgi:hypothetical protein
MGLKTGLHPLFLKRELIAAHAAHKQRRQGRSRSIAALHHIARRLGISLRELIPLEL